MRRIRETPVTQRIGDQKVPEFVVDVRYGNGMTRQQQQAQGKGEQRQPQHDPYGFALDRPQENGRHQQDCEAEFDKIDSAESDRVVQRRREHESSWIA